MSYDLLREKWMRARQANGKVVPVSPLDIGSAGVDGSPLVEIVSHRADFRAAQYQFLVGLAYTALQPKTERDWRTRHTAPPTPPELEEATKSFRAYFDLTHDKTPFMQEAYLAKDPAIRTNGDIQNVSGLCIETPGESTVGKGTDLMQRPREDAFCPPCAASALLTLQLNAPSGGRGQMTSLRGGGPLTTLVMGRTLWETVWLNVLPAESWGHALGAADGPKAFPWAIKWPVAKTDRPRTFSDVHPLHHFWATPRRVLYEWEEGAADCTLCGEKSPVHTRTVRARPDGFQYSGSWQHPLTPWRQDGTERITLKGGPEPAAYRHWLSLITQRGERVRAAPAVVHFRTTRQHRLPEEARRRSLWTGGFSTDKAKIEGWYEGRMPIHPIPDAEQERVEVFAGRLVASSDLAASYLRQAIQAAWDHEGISTTTSDPTSDLWRGTEDAFYHHLDRALVPDHDAPAALLAWRSVLMSSTVAGFDRHAMSGPIAQGEPGRIARARRDLLRRVGGPKLKKTLGIFEGETTNHDSE